MIYKDINRIAALFAKKSQYIPDPVDFRGRALIKPLFGNNYSFVDLAHSLVDILSQLNTDGSDVDVQSTVKALLDLVDIVKIPAADDLIDTANLAYQTISEKTNNKIALAYAKNFVLLAKQIVNKFYDSSKRVKSPEELEKEQQNTAPSKAIAKEEGLVKFLERLFKSVKAGQTPTESDLSYWKANQNILLTRLNALNAIKQRTSLQEQERIVISYLRDNLK
jgi:hypothetical protein